MPKSKKLTEFEQGRAIEHGRQIAFKLGRSKTVIRNFLRNSDSYTVRISWLGKSIIFE